MTRRTTLGVLAAGLLGLRALGSGDPLHAADVPWLADVVRRPRSVPPNDRGPLEPLLVNAQGEPIRSLVEWQQKRRELRAAWLEFLGPMPQKRPPVRLEILREDRDAGCVRQLVQYECEPGEPVRAYLLSPLTTATDRLPALVGLHQTSQFNIEEIAGLKGGEAQHLGPKLARRGFVVICPRNFLWHEADTYQAAVDRFKQRHPETLGMHKMLYDASRAIDVLESLMNVDPQRIGCVGHSLGGKESLYLAALDERVRAAVSSELGIGLSFSNWNAPWYLGPGIAQEGFPLNHHQLVALVAPKPFLLLAGESGSGSVADGDRSWPYLQASHAVCRLYGEPVRIGMHNHRQGHTIPDEVFDMLAEWLDVYLS